MNKKKEEDIFPRASLTVSVSVEATEKGQDCLDCLYTVQTLYTQDCLDTVQT